MDPDSLSPLRPLLTPVAFTAADRQLFMLLEERPLRQPHLQALWAALDAYARHTPCPTWPLVLIDAPGTRRALTTLPDLLLRLSLDGMSPN